MEKYFMELVPYRDSVYMRRVHTLLHDCHDQKEDCNNECRCCPLHILYDQLRRHIEYRAMYINSVIHGYVIYPSGGNWAYMKDDVKKRSKDVTFYRIAACLDDCDYPMFYLDYNDMIHKMTFYLGTNSTYIPRGRSQSHISQLPKQLVSRDSKTVDGSAIDLTRYIRFSVAKRRKKRDLIIYIENLIVKYPDIVYRLLVQYYDQCGNPSKVPLSKFVTHCIKFFERLYNKKLRVGRTSLSTRATIYVKHVPEFVHCVLVPTPYYKFSRYNLDHRQRFGRPLRKDDRTVILNNNLQDLSIISITGTTWRVLCDKYKSGVTSNVGKLIVRSCSGGRSYNKYPVIGIDSNGTATKVDIRVITRHMECTSHKKGLYQFITTPDMLIPLSFNNHRINIRPAINLVSIIIDMIDKIAPETKFLRCYDSYRTCKLFYKYYDKYGGGSKTFITDFCNWYISYGLKQSLPDDVYKYVPFLRRNMFTFDGTSKSFDVVRVMIPLSNPDRGKVNLIDIITRYKSAIFTLVYNKLEEITDIPKQYFKMDNCTLTHDECLSFIFSVKEHPTK